MASNVQWVFPSLEGESFTYNSSRPTYQTERLSYHVLGLLGSLSSSGAFATVTQESDMSSIEAAIDTYIAELSRWLGNAITKVTAYLQSPSSSRALLSLPAAPVLAPITTTSIMALPPALIVKLGTGIIKDVVESYGQWQAANRGNSLVRLIDKAFFKQSFWGDTFDESFFGKILSELKTLNSRLTTPNTDTGEGELSITNTLDQNLLEIRRSLYGESRQSGWLTGIADILVENGNAWTVVGEGEDSHYELRNVVDALLQMQKSDIIKLFCKVYLEGRNTIDSIDFGQGEG